MVELRKARAGEEKAIAALWGRVFGDDGAFLAEFYRLCVPYDQMLVLAEDSVVRSILCAPEMTMRLPNEKALKCGYMYALATDPEARNQGFGREMMRYGEAYLKNEGADCAILVPAEPSLFRFFDSLDYVPAFSHLRREVPGDQVVPERGADPATPGEYNSLRRHWLKGRCYADYGDDLVEFQRYLSQGTGGDLYRLDLPGGAGCAAVELDGETAMVKELLCAPVDLDRALAQVAARHPAGRYILRLPAWDKGFGGQVLWGVVRWLYDRPSPWWPAGQDAYLGLAFD